MQQSSAISHDKSFFASLAEEDINSVIENNQNTLLSETEYYRWLFIVHIICEPDRMIILKRLFMSHINFYLPEHINVISVDVEKDLFDYNINDDMYFVKVKLSGEPLSNVKEVISLYKAICPFRFEIRITSLTIKVNDSKEHNDVFINYPESILTFIKDKCSNKIKNQNTDSLFTDTIFDVEPPIIVLYQLCQIFIKPKSTLKSINDEILFNELFTNLDILNKILGTSECDTFIDRIIMSHNDINICNLNLHNISLYNIYGLKTSTSEYIYNKPSYDDFCYVFDNYYDKIHITLGVSKIENKIDFINRKKILTYDTATFNIKGSPKKNLYYEDVVEDIKDSNNKFIGQFSTKRPIFPKYAMVFIDKLEEILLHNSMTMKVTTKTFKINSNTTYTSAVITLGYHIDYDNNMYIGSFAFTGLKDVVIPCLYRLGVMTEINSRNNIKLNTFKINN